jgi:hypothetical protein
LKKIYDAVVITGKYMKNGEEKNRYLTVGAVFEGDKGLSMKLEALPVAGFNGWINFYEPKGEQKSVQKSAEPDFNDEVGF